jgi:hypothetical protein
VSEGELLKKLFSLWTRAELKEICVNDPRLCHILYETIPEIVDEARKEFPKMPFIPPFVVEENFDELMKSMKGKELSEWIRKVLHWRLEWFGSDENKEVSK